MRSLVRPSIVAPVVAVLLAGAGSAAAGGRLDLVDDGRARSPAALVEALDPAGVDARRLPGQPDGAAIGVSVPVLPEQPPGVTGEPTYFVAGPGVAAVWRRTTGMPQLVVARASVPDELPVAAILASLADDGRVETSTARIGGNPATVLSTSDGSLAAVVWTDSGVTTLVGGWFDADEIVAIAGSVR